MDDLTGASEQKKRIEDRYKRLAERDTSDLKKTWGTTEGRRYMFKIIRASGYVDGAGVPTDRDVAVRERKIGRWEFGHALATAAHKVAPDLYHVAEREALNDKLLRDQEIKNQGGSAES